MSYFSIFTHVTLLWTVGASLALVPDDGVDGHLHVGEGGVAVGSPTGRQNAQHRLHARLQHPEQPADAVAFQGLGN